MPAATRTKSKTMARNAPADWGPALLRSPPPQSAWFDERAADLACDFFERYLVHSRGEWQGQPFRLAPWQRELIIRPLFGWKLRPRGRRARPREGEHWLRLYRRVYVKIPKKNGKSTLAAGVGLDLAFADGEPGADVYCIANKEDQADIVHGEAKRMVRQSAELSGMLQVFTKSIIRPETMQGFQRLATQGASLDGLSPHGLIIDELHEFTDRKAYETLSNACGARREPVEFIITTAGVPSENRLYAEIDDHARAVARGGVDDHRLLVVMFETPEEADWHDPETWKAANPNYGSSCKADYLEDQHRKAVLVPANESSFRRYNLDQNVSRKDGWMPIELWDRCDKPFEPEGLAGMPCVVGMDLSSKKDITAIVAAFRLGGDIAWLPHFFKPEEGVDEAEKTDHWPYREWARAGLLTLVRGRVIRDDVILAKLQEWSGLYQLLHVRYDPWGAGQLVDDLEAEGIVCKEFRQGFKSMSPAMKALEEKILSRMIIHGANPILRRMFASVRVDGDAAENIKPNKRKSTQRIDGIVAGIMATAGLLESDEGPSVYEERGIDLL